jgi:hypothetical protein
MSTSIVRPAVRGLFSQFGYVPPDVDAQAVALFRSVRPFTMTSIERVYALRESVKLYHPPQHPRQHRGMRCVEGRQHDGGREDPNGAQDRARNIFSHVPRPRCGTVISYHLRHHQLLGEPIDNLYCGKSPGL